MKRLVILGILMFLGVLLATFPARVAYNWFAPAQLQLSGIAGSIWNGSAAAAQVGDAYIQDISWKFAPMSLLSGTIGFRTHSSPASGTMNTEVAVGTGGKLLLSELTGNLPLDLLHPALQQSGIRGDIALEFETIEIRNGVPVEALGTITISDFYVPELSTSRIGDFRAEIRTNDDALVGSIEDVAGVLDVAGTVSLDRDGLYSFVGQVAPTPMTPQSIVNQLQYLGSPNARGQHEFRFEGQL